MDPKTGGREAAKRLAELEREIEDVLKDDEKVRAEMADARTKLPWWLRTGTPAGFFLAALVAGVLLFVFTKSYRLSESFILVVGTIFFVWLLVASTRPANWRHWPEQQLILERLAPLYQERNELLAKIEGQDHEDIEPFDDHPEIEEAAREATGEAATEADGEAAGDEGK